MNLLPKNETHATPEALRLAAHILERAAHRLAHDLDKDERTAGPVIEELSASSDALRHVADLLWRAKP